MADLGEHMKAVSTEVLIVGAGPAGAASAVFLARYGVRCLMISRHRSTSETPRAHITNQRAMEALRDAGLEGACMAVASPSAAIEHTFFLRSMVGEEIARVRAWGNDPSRVGDYIAASRGGHRLGDVGRCHAQRQPCCRIGRTKSIEIPGNLRAGSTDPPPLQQRGERP